MQTDQKVTPAQKSIVTLRETLRRHIEQSEEARRYMAKRITESNDAALHALRDPSLRLIYLGALSKQIMMEFDAADQGEEQQVLDYCVRNAERWLEGWNPITGSSPLSIVHAGAEYEAGKLLLGQLREARAPKSAAAKRTK